jgi:glucose-1-phosphate thymidylyltransferase
MKGIILAGGLGTRLRPLTNHVSKGLLPVAGKPLVQYNIETMWKAGIEDICLVVRPDQATQYALAFGNSVNLRFQARAKGISDAILVAEKWAGPTDIMVLLGDSIFGHFSFARYVEKMSKSFTETATIFYAHEKEPHWCAQIEWEHDIRKPQVRDIHEKPTEVVSYDVVPGCYMYPPDVFNRIRKLEPSERGELEITDLNRAYLRDRKLDVVKYEGLWLDAGTDMKAYIKAQTEPNLP